MHRRLLATATNHRSKTMNRQTRKRTTAFERLALPLAAGCALAASAVSLAQEPAMRPATPTPATEAVPPQPAGTGETTTQHTTPGANIERHRLQREQEQRDAETVVRQRATDDDETTKSPAGYANTALRDAWLDGKLEASFALNRHLNPFTIDTEVENGMVRLSGHVDSEIDRELATEVAKNVEGVTAVRNDLEVRAGKDDSAAERPNERTFAQRVDDATTTAAVKSRLLIEDQTQGLRINVSTLDHVVTLSGEVQSDEEKRLAEQIAGNVDEVQRVQNELQVVNTAEQPQ
jgi:osmotically-inducible protein OsmY